jgi:hypothetical protein
LVLVTISKASKNKLFHERIDPKNYWNFGKFFDLKKIQEPWLLYQNWLFEKY